MIIGNLLNSVWSKSSSPKYPLTSNNSLFILLIVGSNALSKKINKSRLGRTVDRTSTIEVFEDIYHSCKWGKRDSVSGSVSGSGSSRGRTTRLVQDLPNIMSRYGVRSVLDIPCGDFNWMRHVDLTGIDYTGADIVRDLVERNGQYKRSGIQFQQLDLLESSLPKVDLVFTRDCLVHLSFEQIRRALHNIALSGSRLLMTTTFPGRSRNYDIKTGGWRPLNLELAPFHLPYPILYLFEYSTEAQGRYADKSMGLWEVDLIATQFSASII